jgi:HSP20 family protein
MNEEEFSIENRLKELRKQHKLSQEELADSLGISRQSIIAIEQGKYLPSLPLVVSMCKFFHSPFEDLFNFSEEIEREFDNMINDTQKNIKILNNPEENSGRKDGNMSGLEPWRPFREAVTLRDAVDRLFEDSVVSPKGAGMPKIDIKDQKDSIVVKAELPGISEDRINVEIADGVMTISGEKAEEKEEKDEGYYYKESHTGAFSRSFTLPADVMENKAEAEMKNGILMITVPKVAPKQATKVKIGKK